VNWTRFAVLGLLAATLGAPAFAQQGQPAQEEQPGGFGLDLSDEGQKKEQEEAKKKEAAEKKAAEEPGHPAAAAAAAPAADADKDKDKASGAMQGERDITQEDRVKAVQRKVYLRARRFELTPMVSASINDPFFWKFSAALRAGYYFADTLAISARFNIVATIPTDDRRLASQTFSARILRSVPQWMGMGDLEWSPFYGKVAVFNSILHFDAYLVGGIGTVYTETSDNRLPNPAADMGAGVRFQVFDYLAVGVSVINTAYVDQPLGTNKSTTQNILGLYGGVSIFFPFRSTGREAE
jgi:outer membrane beta-barrel protein